jgi:hypothetical protein
MDHAVDVGRDAALVAEVELLERAIVARANSGDERIVVVAIGSRTRTRKRCSG